MFSLMTWCLYAAWRISASKDSNLSVSTLIYFRILLPLFLQIPCTHWGSDSCEWPKMICDYIRTKSETFSNHLWRLRHNLLFFACSEIVYSSINIDYRDSFMKTTQYFLWLIFKFLLCSSCIFGLFVCLFIRMRKA